jgi:long-subunit fatty acid transport protein
MAILRLLSLSMLMILFSVAMLSAQSSSGDTFSESSADNFSGIGGRAVGMSEAVTASVLDGTALLYNPAGLVRVKRLEFYGALSNERVKCVSSWLASPTSPATTDNFTKTRLNSLSLTVPVPTYRGSLVLAFAVNRTKSFDRTFTFASGTIGIASQNALEQAMGGMREWSAGAGMEISQHLAVGTTLIYYRGDEDYSWDYTANFQGEDMFGSTQYVDQISSTYSGVGIRLGMIAEVNPYLTLGLTIDSPTRFKIKQDYSQVTIESGNRHETVGSYEYDLQHPFSFNAGAAFRISTFTLEGDIGYADWSQLEYKSEADKPNNKALQKYYSDAVQLRFGAEYVIPQYGVVLRGGFKHDPLPIAGTLMSNQIEKNRNSFSAGLGFLIDRIVMLDIAYAHASYKLYDGERDVSSKYTSDKVLLSVGYRI